MNQKTVFLIVAIAALAAVGITTAILSAAAPANADSCQKTIGLCHGCSPFGTGFVNSERTCAHRG